MTIFRCMALLSLGIAFCIGCSDSSQQSWESSKSSGHKKALKGETADNDEPETAAADNPHKTTNPHGATNPHEGMQMPGAGAMEEPAENNGKLDIDTIHFTVPKTWIAKAHSKMLAAEFAIPHAEGDKKDVRLTISHLGGTLEDNVARWKAQFGDKPDKENEETLKAGAIKIVLVDFTGTFNESSGPMMMNGPTVARPDYRMLGAIFQVPGDDLLYFIKCYGPKKTMAAAADEVKNFLTSLKVDK